MLNLLLNYICYSQTCSHTAWIHICDLLIECTVMSSFAGIPVIVTYPHFYDCDPFYLNAVEGLNPQPNLHRMQLDIEPVRPARNLVVLYEI